MQQSPDLLLSLSSLFEKRAFNKLSKFIKEADRDSLLSGLALIASKPISDDIFDEWLALNASSLGNVLDYKWFVTQNAHNETILISISQGTDPNKDIRKIISKTPIMTLISFYLMNQF